MPMRSAGIRVFLFWLAVVVAAFLIPGAAGMWNADVDPAEHRASRRWVSWRWGTCSSASCTGPVIAAVGVGIAAAFYVPSYLAGDAALAVSAAATLLVVALAWTWIRRSGVL